MNNLSVEELLKPRYKVIAGDTTRNFKVGDIFTEWKLQGYGDAWIQNYHLQNSKHNIVNNLSQFPHLFKKLEWWEERKESDMPEYVKWKHLNQVFKIAELNYTNQMHLLSTVLPATAEEYNNQKIKV